MVEREEIVASLVAAGGGKLIGRIRLQKALYLLQELGFGTDLPFEYHHYGPYSRDLDNATADAKALGLVRERFEHRHSDGAMYSIFELVSDAAVKAEIYEKMGKAKVAELVELFAGTNVTVLELAATVDWLWRHEDVADWRAEVIRRKGKKTEGGRLDKAIDLLNSLGLQPKISA